MKALTIRQPYAALIAIGEKKYETRSWSTSYRGSMAIHSSKKQLGKLSMAFWPIFYPAGFTHEDLVFGCIIATCNLVDCIKVEDLPRLPNKEMMLGDFTLGRFAWKIEDVHLLEKPIPIKGNFGLWNLRCHSDTDGECNWELCPQKQDYKPYCPIAKIQEESGDYAND
jgi:hypothetical protein